VTKAKSKKRQKKRQAVRQQYYKALSHELRTEIWTYLIEKSSGSPSEIARALGAETPEVSHHMRQLEKYGVVELVDERPTRKGSPEKIYRPIGRPLIADEEVEEMPLPAREGFVRQILQALVRDLHAGSEAHAFTKRTDWHLSRTPMSLDAEGFDEVRQLYARALQEVLDIQARSDERRAQSGKDPIRVSASLLCFAMED
jgi:DNA-binding transcriptional ArsR family regulator